VISGTSKNSPAEKAGLRAGDTIVELGGMKIKNIYDYVYCLQAMKANVKTSMHIVRDGKEQELQITPLLKE
jgi:S1-C subfamily serine protease